jgi:hypothetical protein
VRFNPLAGAAAVLVLVLAASALSGFLTGGTSFNPLNGVELVVQRLTGTQPVQKVTRGQVEARLAEARGALADGDLERARREVGQARGLAAALAPNDRDAVRPQIVRLEQQIETAQARRTRGTLEGAPAPGPVPPDGPYPPVVPSVASAAD